MRVLLLNANRLKVPYPVFPLGLDHVAAAIAPHQARLLDLCPCPEGGEAQAIAEAIREHSPQAVGISLRNVDNTDGVFTRGFLPDIRAVVEAVRAATGVPLILGGAGYTLFPAELLQALGADYGIVGEGERLKGLLDALEQGNGALSGAAPEGVAVRGKNAPTPAPWSGLVVRSRSQRGNPQLDFYLGHGGMLSLQTQRGCPFRCVYCTYPSIEGRALRPLDLAEVGRTARALQDDGARHLVIADSTFNAEPAHALAVARAFREAGLTIPWAAYFSPRAPPDGFYREMAAAGCTHVEFGTDALCDAMLVRDQKPFRLRDVLASHEAAREAGLNVAHFLLLGGPGETSSTVDETLANAEKLLEAALFFFCGMRVYPGTDLHRIALAQGQLAPGTDLLEPVYYRPPQIGLEEIALRVAKQARGRSSWIVGGGGEWAARIMSLQYERGVTGPLWEKVI